MWLWHTKIWHKSPHYFRHFWGHWNQTGKSHITDSCVGFIVMPPIITCTFRSWSIIQMFQKQNPLVQMPLRLSSTNINRPWRRARDRIRPVCQAVAENRFSESVVILLSYPLIELRSFSHFQDPQLYFFWPSLGWKGNLPWFPFLPWVLLLRSNPWFAIP